MLKIVFAVINTLFSDNGYSFPVIFASFLLSLFIFVIFYSSKPYHNPFITIMYITATGMLAYSFGVLSFCYIIKDMNFSGGLPLCFVGNSLIVVYFKGKFNDPQVNLNILIQTQNQLPIQMIY